MKSPARLAPDAFLELREFLRHASASTAPCASDSDEITSRARWRPASWARRHHHRLGHYRAAARHAGIDLVALVATHGVSLRPGHHLHAVSVISREGE